jgi:uncharacterized protein (DUF2225 family)
MFFNEAQAMPTAASSRSARAALTGPLLSIMMFVDSFQVLFDGKSRHLAATEMKAAWIFSFLQRRVKDKNRTVPPALPSA